MPCRSCSGGSGASSRRPHARPHSVYSRKAEGRAPPAHSPAPYVQPPRRSMFRDAAAIAGGVAVGQTMGNIVSGGLASLFGGRSQREVVEILPRDYQVGTDPNGPCAYEISQFIQCATDHQTLEECEYQGEALRNCKKHYRIP